MSHSEQHQQHEPDPEDASDLITGRLESLHATLPPPPTIECEFSSSNHSTTSINPLRIQPSSTPGHVPITFKTAPTRQLVLPIVRSLLDFVQDQGRFPTVYLNSEYYRVHGMKCVREADRIRPSGEAGLSHWLKMSLFDRLNDLADAYFVGAGQTRYWKVVGIGKAGKTDWGLFVDGVLRALVELKPNCVLGPSKMTSVCVNLKRLTRAETSSKPRTDTAKIITQMYAQYSLAPARGSVRYAVVLCESTRDWTDPANPSTRKIGGLSTALVFDRHVTLHPDYIAIADNPITTAAAISPEDPISCPAMLLLALTVMPKGQLDPVTRPQDPPLPPPRPTYPPPTSTLGSLGGCIAPDDNPPPRPAPGLLRGGQGADGDQTGRDEPPAGRQGTRSSARQARQGPKREGDSGRDRDTGKRGRNAQHLTVNSAFRLSSGHHPRDNVDPDFSIEVDDIEQVQADTSDSSMESIESAILFEVDERARCDTPHTPPSSDIPAELDIFQYPLQSFELLPSADHPLQEYAREGILEFHGPIPWTQVTLSAWHSTPILTQRQQQQQQQTETSITTEACSTLRFRLGDEIGSGAVWTTFSVSIASSSRSALSDHPADKQSLLDPIEGAHGIDTMVLKLCIPSRHDLLSDPDSVEFSQDDVRISIKRELDILTGPLARLQGSVVPMIRQILIASARTLAGKEAVRKQRGPDLGVWGIMMDKGDIVAIADDLLWHEKHQVVDTYRRIHELGVLHSDVRLSNLLFYYNGETTSSTTATPEQGPTRVRGDLGMMRWAHQHPRGIRIPVISDFGQSKLKGDFDDEEEWSALCDNELSNVREMLGLMEVTCGEAQIRMEQ